MMVGLLMVLAMWPSHQLAWKSLHRASWTRRALGSLCLGPEILGAV